VLVASRRGGLKGVAILLVSRPDAVGETMEDLPVWFAERVADVG
jgi:hypothetical protein